MATEKLEVKHIFTVDFGDKNPDDGIRGSSFTAVPAIISSQVLK